MKDKETRPEVAWVTGGSAGIGKAVCRQLLKEGYEVVSLARRCGDIEHPRMHSVQVDLLDPKATAEAIGLLTGHLAPTVVVHNAGVIRPALLPDVKLYDLHALTALHLGCAIQMVQAALPTMKSRGWGRVVLLSSRAAQGLQQRTCYSATKAGMMGMARTWALELAPLGVTVNVVAPGPIRTDMFHEVVEAGSDQAQRIAASIPVGRVGEAEDVARAVSFFVSSSNGFVTGQTLYVCGGTSVGGLAF